MRHKENEMSDSKRTAKLPNQMSLYIRLFAAAYLLYLAFSFGDVWNRYTGGELLLYVAAMIAFGVIGLGIGIVSVRDLIKGRYVGGKLDNSTEEMLENKASE